MDKLINFTDYSYLDIGLIFAGTIMWILAYTFILINAIKNKFIEMPAPAAASNLAWEFVWGFLLVTNLGLLFQWGLRIWFFMDVFIFYFVIKYGAKQFNNQVYKKNLVWIEWVLLAVWIPVFYYFYQEGYDTLMGTTSAYIITVVMATLFLINFYNAKDKKYFTSKVAISKFLGNTFMTVFVFIHHSDFIFVKILTIVVLILNILYIVEIYKHKNKKS